MGGDGSDTKAWLKPAIAFVVVAFVLNALFGVGVFWSVIVGLIAGGAVYGFFGRKAADAARASARTSAPGSAPGPAPAPGPTPGPAAPAPAAEAAPEPIVPPAAAATAPLVRPSTALPGQAELAARKGTWVYQSNKDA